MTTIIWIIMLIFGLTHLNSTLIITSGLFAVSASIGYVSKNIEDVQETINAWFLIKK